jgi:N utilization substance protein B
MGRRAARETAMKLIYQIEIRKENIEDQISDVLEESSLNLNDRKYIEDLAKGIFNNKEQIDKIIETLAKGWKLNRISKVDLSIMRISIYEQLFRNDIPFSVSANEAVELAKKYSSDEAGCFINGILSKFAQSKQVTFDSSVLEKG